VHDAPAIALRDVRNAVLRDMNAVMGNNVFVKVSGDASRSIRLVENDFADAKVPYELDKDVRPKSVTTLDNFSSGN
jgi:hypothetical protein